MIDYKIGQRVIVESAGTRAAGTIRDAHATVGLFVVTDQPITIRLGTDGPLVSATGAWFSCSGNPIMTKYRTKVGLAVEEPVPGITILGLNPVCSFSCRRLQ